MKCRNPGCNWNNSNMLLLERHEQRCTRIRLRKPILKSTPRRFGGHASLVASDNVRSVEVNETEATHENDGIEEVRMSGLKMHKVEEMGVLIEEIGRRTNQKLAQRLINLMNNQFPLEAFSQHCQSFSDCRALTEKLIASTITDLKFSKGTIRIGSVESEFYYRCPVSLLQAQVLQVNYGDMLKERCIGVDIFGRTCISNPFSAKLGHEGINAIKQTVQGSDCPDVYWRDEEDGIGNSFVGLGQLYSDKSQASLKPDAFTFYPLHITMFNFPEHLRRSLIVKGMTAVAYLPVSFLSTDEPGNYSAERTERINIVQQTISKVLAPLRDKAKSGFPCQTNDKIKLHCHFAIANYCADIPEAKDLLGVLHSNRTTHPCFRCLVGKEDLSVFKDHQLRTLDDTKRIRSYRQTILNESRSINKNNKKNVVVIKSRIAEANKELIAKSMTSQECFLETFPFVGLTKVLDMYQIFSLEPLHALHIGISKLLKNLVYDRLGDSSLTSSAIRNKRFNTIRFHVLAGVNQMISQFHTESYAPGLYLDLVSKHKGNKMNGLYTEHGLRGFLEAKNMKGIDRIFPFLAAFIDRCCGEKEYAPTTKVAVLFTDLVRLAERRGMAAGWVEPELQELEKKVVEFKREALQLYGNYQKSGMNTVNFHLLDHLVSDIRRNGGLQYGDACLYEHSHVKVKQSYRETSKRKQTALKETLESYHKTLLKLKVHEAPTAKNYKGARYASFENGNAVLVRDGRKIRIHDLKMAREYIRNQRKGRDMISCEAPDAMQLVRDIGEDGTQSLVRLLQEEFADTANISFVRVSSAYLTGGYTPTADDIVRDKEGVLQIKYLENDRFVSQRVVSCRGFHGGDVLRQDCVMIERDTKEAGLREVWIAKLLALLRVRDEEFAFVQYFDAVSDTDNCMKILGCVNLRISRADNCDEDRGFGKYFGLVPTGSLRGSVHVVRGDHGSPQTLEESDWPDQIYHVNRFYVDPDEIEFSKP